MEGLKQVAGFWLPASETYLVDVLEKSPRFYKGPTYQVDKLMACLPYIGEFGTALDVGAHCGLWSRILVKLFRQVLAFEPVPVHRDCFMLNVAGANLYGFGLGTEIDQAVSLASDKGSTGNTSINGLGSINAKLTALDSLDVGSPDFIKIDCEGYEFFAIAGGEDTIRRTKPCIIVEQKRGMASKYGLGDTDAVELLKDWGASVRFEMSGDYCLSWD